jgi:hypothetical protein
VVSLEDSSSSVLCDIEATDIFGSRLQRFVWRNDSSPTYLRVLNVDCGIYPDMLADTDRLERAFRDLPGVGARPATVPSQDAIHD